MKKKLLIIEDEPSVAKELKQAFEKEYDITIAGEAGHAKKLLASRVFPVAILDISPPSFPNAVRQGFALLERLPSLAPHTRVIVISDNSDEENAMKAIALGATDFFEQPVDLELMGIVLSRTFRIHELEQAGLRLLRQKYQSGSLCGMIGISPPMKKVFELIRLAAANDYPVLITGKTGTGKEMAAKAIHCLSPRAEKPMIAINCGAIPENLLESELFGHEKGAFTGAVARKVGRFEQADKGTIFLDEISELPLSLQVKLLRFLQEATIERLGGTRTITLNVRIIAATNIDLEDAGKKGAFREDLFYRLNVVKLRLPDLRERPEDILPLAHHFLEEESQRLGRRMPSLSAAAVAAITKHDWPGNVRELQNRIRGALATTTTRVLYPADLGLEEPAGEGEEQRLPTLKEAREMAEKDVVRRALALTGNNISQAARLLNISRPTLHDLLKKHRIGKHK